MRVQAFFEGKTEREKKYLLAAASIFATAVIFVGIVEPIIKRVSHLHAQLPELRAEARLIEKKSDEIQRYQSKRIPGAKPFEHLIEAAKAKSLALDVDLKAHENGNMTIFIKEITIQQWIDFQHELTRFGIDIMRLKLVRAGSPGLFDIEIDIKDRR